MPTTNASTATRRALAALAAGSLAILACAGVRAEEARDDGVFKDHVDWGVLMDLSGPAAASQSVWVAGLQDRVKKVDQDGGVNGRKIDLLIRDNRFSAAADVLAFDELVTQTPVIALSGLGASASQVALAQTIRNGKAPVIGTYTPTVALSEPASPMVYNGFCGYRQMAEAGIGYYVDHLGLKAPKVMTVAIETAGGRDYSHFVAETAAKYGGSATAVTMKVSALDMTAQVREIVAQKPDLITIYGVEKTAIMTMKALAENHLGIPAFGITYLGTPAVYKAIGPEAGANYTFVSCFTPGGSDQSPGDVAMSAFADSVGHGALKGNVNYVAGWVAGGIAAEALAKAGPDPSRQKLVDALAPGFTVDTQGLSAPIVYTTDDHTGPKVLKLFGYDYAAGRFKAFGDWGDYAKYAK